MDSRTRFTRRVDSHSGYRSLLRNIVSFIGLFCMWFIWIHILDSHVESIHTLVSRFTQWWVDSNSIDSHSRFTQSIHIWQFPPKWLHLRNLYIYGFTESIHNSRFASIHIWQFPLKWLHLRNLYIWIHVVDSQQSIRFDSHSRFTCWVDSHSVESIHIEMSSVDSHIWQFLLKWLHLPDLYIYGFTLSIHTVSRFT